MEERSFNNLETSVNTDESQQINTEAETDNIGEGSANNTSNQDTEMKIEKGKTAKEMDRLAEKWMKHCVRAVSLPTLLEIMEPIAPELTEDIKEIHSQGEEYMMAEFKRLSANIFEEKKLTEKQNKLDRLKEEAESRKRVEAQLVPTPSQVTEGVLHRTKRQEVLRLEKVLENLIKENFDIMNKVQLADEERKKKQAKLDLAITELEENAQVALSISQTNMVETMEYLKINSDLQELTLYTKHDADSKE